MVEEIHTQPWPPQVPRNATPGLYFLCKWWSKNQSNSSKIKMYHFFGGRVQRLTPSHNTTLIYPKSNLTTVFAPRGGGGSFPRFVHSDSAYQNDVTLLCFRFFEQLKSARNSSHTISKLLCTIKCPSKRKHFLSETLWKIFMPRWNGLRWLSHHVLDPKQLIPRLFCLLFALSDSTIISEITQRESWAPF